MKTKIIIASMFSTILSLVGSVLIVTCLLGCEHDDVMHIDCVGNISANLPNHEFKTGYVNEYYYDEIVASVSNEPNDHHYDYFFSVEGRIPEGLEVVINDRTLAVTGQPAKIGLVKFKVFLEVEPYYPETNVCANYRTSKEYEFIIAFK